jgi:diaminopimelate decarboxylase
VNPDVEAHTHKKITTGTYANKFGIAFEHIEGVYARAAKLKHLRLRGFQMHIGSQITEVKPFHEAARKVLPLIKRLKQKYNLEFFSIGGGLGIVYKPALASGSAAWWKSPAAKNILTPQTYADHLIPLLQDLDLRILMEPGRFISGSAGALLTRIEYVKRTGKKNFLIVDAAMNDLIRPAFYEAYHEIIPLDRVGVSRIKSDVVGPICESGDFFCQDRPMPKVGQGNYLALLSAGAYGFVMASNYNTRRLAAEVLVNGNHAALVRDRQPAKEIWAGEKVAPWLR